MKEMPNSFHHYTLRKESLRCNIFHFALLLENSITTLTTDSHLSTVIGIDKPSSCTLCNNFQRC